MWEKDLGWPQELLQQPAASVTSWWDICSNYHGTWKAAASHRFLPHRVKTELFKEAPAAIPKIPGIL